MEKQPSFAHVGNEHRIWHGSTRTDTVADAALRVSLVVTVTHVVGDLTCLVALLMHVPLPVCAVSCVDGTQDRGHGQVAAGSGAVPRGTPSMQSSC